MENQKEKLYDQTTIDSLNTTMDKENKEMEEKIKNTIKWGEKAHPLASGDYLIGKVEAIEAGRDAKTEKLTFINIKGKGTVDKVAHLGHFSVIANPVLKTGIRNGIIKIGKTVFIRFEGMVTGKNWKDPYKKFSVKEVETN